MGTASMNSKNIKTSDPHKLLLNLTVKINLNGSDKFAALSNLSICYTWKNMKKGHTRTVKLKYQPRHWMRSLN